MFFALRAAWVKKKKISFYSSLGAVWTEKSIFTAPLGLFGLKIQVLGLLKGLFGLIIWFYNSLGVVWVKKIRFYGSLGVVWLNLWAVGMLPCFGPKKRLDFGTDFRLEKMGNFD